MPTVRSVPFVCLVLALAVPAGVLAGSNAAPPSPAERGVTGRAAECPLPLPTVDATGRTVVRPRGAAATAGPSSPWGPRAEDPAWELVDEQSIFERLEPGARARVTFDRAAESLVPETPGDPLTSTARQAVDRAPTWLQKELEDQLARLDAATQDRLAQLILDAEDPYVDETAFLVAHVSPTDLTSGDWNDQLIEDSATYPYEVDPYLDYVKVVDHGSAADGGDYWTTVSYDVERDGTVYEDIEYPKEYYYWYILHPRGSDEFPTYIDPTQCSSGGTPAPPPTGKFWRRWFFYGADNAFGGKCDVDWDGTRDEDCPVLKDMLAGQTVMWAHLKDTTGPANGALGMVSDWVRQSIGPFGDKDGCRPVEPVTIYYHGDGNCGEWGDLTMAASRAALLPMVNTETHANDHVWNSFWDELEQRWVNFEPVGPRVDYSYENWWGSKLAATHTWRGDGWGTTELTALNGPTATLVVTVYDANHRPIDGAEVRLGSEWDALPLIIMEISRDHTDKDGKVTFTVGDQRNFYVVVTTPGGNRWPDSGWGQVIADSQPDTEYDFSPPDFPDVVPQLDADGTASSEDWDDWRVVADFTVTEGIVHGNGFSTDIRYAREHAGGLETFVVDDDGWDDFVAGSHFMAYDLVLDDGGRTIDFIPPAEGNWHVAWSNTSSLDMVHVVRGTVKLYRNTGAVPPVEHLTVDKDADDASLLDWEDVAGHNVDGYNVYRSTAAADVGRDRTEQELEPYLLATTVESEYTDPDAVPAGQCFFYSVRTRSRKGGISP